MKQDAIAIVDPLSSGTLYVQIAKSMGYKTVAITTQDQLPSSLKKLFSIENFDYHHHHRSLAETAAFIKEYHVKAVVPAGQLALNDVDHIAEHARLIGNPVASYKSRINKKLMKSTLQSKNIACANYIEIDSPIQANSWLAANGFPVVMKPSEGTGGLGVHVCNNYDEIEKYFPEISKLDGIYREHNTKVLLETYLPGDEYFISTLNHKNFGAKLLAIGKYEKFTMNGLPNIYKNIFSQPITNNFAHIAFTYACAVNNALDVHFGINDIEFKLTPQGPVIVEINNRLPGANVPALIQACTGLNLYRENIRIFSGDYFPSQEPIIYEKHFCICCLINEEPGVVTGFDNIEEIKQLKSYHDMKLMYAVSEHAPQTIDFLTTFGYVYLIHEDMDQLKADAEFVHQYLKLRIK